MVGCGSRGEEIYFMSEGPLVTGSKLYTKILLYFSKDYMPMSQAGLHIIHTPYIYRNLLIFMCSFKNSSLLLESKRWHI